jgi:hypothetical protein
MFKGFECMGLNDISFYMGRVSDRRPGAAWTLQPTDEGGFKVIVDRAREAAGASPCFSPCFGPSEAWRHSFIAGSQGDDLQPAALEPAEALQQLTQFFTVGTVFDAVFNPYE